MTKRERSAGIVAFRETAEGRQYLLLDHGEHWDFSKGHVEAGEDDRSAALREFGEETGIRQVQLIPGFAREIQYYFRAGRDELIHKRVIFFLGRIETSSVALSSEHVGFDLLRFAAARKRLTYSASRQVLEEAETFLK